jgi:hypothetical protein
LDASSGSCSAGHCRRRFNLYPRKFPDGTVIWTSPSGQAYTTHPGSRLLFPSLCRPTAPVSTPANAPSAQPNRGLMMPRRKTTREQDRAKRIEAQRARNREIRETPEKACEDAYFPSLPPPPGETDDPPPF